MGQERHEFDERLIARYCLRSRFDFLAVCSCAEVGFIMAAPASTPPINDLSTLPLVLTIPDMSRLLRRSIGTIRRDLQRHTFRPFPKWTRPYRWLRIDVERYLAQISEQLTAEAPLTARVRPTRRRKIA